MFERFTKDARRVVTDSITVATGAGADKVAPEHLLLAVAADADGDGARLLAGYGVTEAALAAALTPATGRAGLTEDEITALRAVGIDADEVFRRIEEAFGTDALHEPSPVRPRRRGRLGSPFSPPAKKVLELSLREAIAMRHRAIGSGHILLALLRQGLSGPVAEVLTRHGVDHDSARDRLRADLPRAA
jgi:ATP-dependent Clp protease ATP-binding subunit ClpA